MCLHMFRTIVLHRIKLCLPAQRRLFRSLLEQPFSPFGINKNRAGSHLVFQVRVTVLDPPVICNGNIPPPWPARKLTLLADSAHHQPAVITQLIIVILGVAEDLAAVSTCDRRDLALPPLLFGPEIIRSNIVNISFLTQILPEKMIRRSMAAV